MPLQIKFRIIYSLQFLVFALLTFIQITHSQNFVKITDPNNPVVSDPGFPIGSYNGAAWVDYNNDGLLDLFVARQSVIYKNTGNGNFEKITINVQNISLGTSWGDFDNDGFIDVLLTAGSARGSSLYKNNGDGSFTKVVNGATGDSIYNSAWGCAFGDYNNDGFIDIVLAAANNFIGINHENRLLLNNGNGTFTNIDTTAVTDTLAPFTVPIWSDYDQDGDIDMFIGSGPATNTPTRDYLYKNLLKESGVWGFSRINTPDIGTDLVDGQVWNWIDYDNDGDLDAFLTNYSGNINNRLYRNNGNDTYTNMTQAEVGTIVSDQGSSLANVWGDFDNDGFIDCYITNDGGQFSWYYKNNGNGTFTRNDALAVRITGPVFGASAGDYDNDGDLDLYAPAITSSKGLFRNDLSNGYKWVNIKCVGIGGATGSNLSAIGTRIKAKANINGIPTWQIREVSAQNTFNGMNMLNVHFGFGNAAVIDSLVITWSRGLTQTFTNVAVNKFYNATEGQGLNEILIGIKEINAEIPGTFALYQNYPNPFNPSTKIKFDIPSNVKRQTSNVKLVIFDVIGKEITTLVNEQLNPGTYEVKWNAANYPTGVYFYKLTAGSFAQTKKLILVK
ncbi:MAG: T9SS C-terminal target domain-containing protein [Ignavibacteriae bacterium]|nr:MAG: T9SS C-terminal target domain-containing protein [Ignavibacteriota bacterium]